MGRAIQRWSLSKQLAVMAVCCLLSGTALAFQAPKEKIRRDTTYLLLSDSQMVRAIREMKTHDAPQGLAPGVIAIISALVGAVAALGSQLIMFFFGTRRDITKLKNELIAQERSLSILLSEYCKELARVRVSLEFWYQVNAISNDDRDYDRYLATREVVATCRKNINSTLAEYFKATIGFVSQSKENQVILAALEEIRTASFLQEKSRRFSEVKDIDTLNDLVDPEVNRLTAEYLKLIEITDRIYAAMNDE